MYTGRMPEFGTGCIAVSMLFAVPRPLSRSTTTFHLKMPFFERSKRVTITGGQFSDVGGDWNQFDYSQHVRHDNSHNNNATTTVDSNNDASLRNTLASKFWFSLEHLSEPDNFLRSERSEQTNSSVNLTPSYCFSQTHGLLSTCKSPSY
jgi:hypothetical protein